MLVLNLPFKSLMFLTLMRQSLSLHDALPISGVVVNGDNVSAYGLFVEHYQKFEVIWNGQNGEDVLDRKSTRLNSSHVAISYAVFCLKNKIQGSNVPNPDETVLSFVSAAMAKA